MRRILVDNARRKKRTKRDGELRPVELDRLDEAFALGPRPRETNQVTGPIRGAWFVTGAGTPALRGAINSAPASESAPGKRRAVQRDC